MRRLVNLISNVVQAAHVPRGDVVSSIFGPQGSRARSPKGAPIPSEFDHFWPNNLGALRSLGKTLLTPLPYVHRLWYQASGYLPPPDPRAGFERERWFFVNGICTNRPLALDNARALSALFGRPIHVLYNATDGLFVDLFECAVGKDWSRVTESVLAAFPYLHAALRDPTLERVVLISHSQGTIVASVMLKLLEELLMPASQRAPIYPHSASPERLLARKLTGDFSFAGNVQGSSLGAGGRVIETVSAAEVAKLELFCFANCATSMEPFVSLPGAPDTLYPRIESYGNEYDIVARLGVLAPNHGIGGTRIGGERFVRRNTSGHMLNAHYLADFQAECAALAPVIPALEALHDAHPVKPRLMRYANGGHPLHGRDRGQATRVNQALPAPKAPTAKVGTRAKARLLANK